MFSSIKLGIQSCRWCSTCQCCCTYLESWCLKKWKC